MILLILIIMVVLVSTIVYANTSSENEDNFDDQEEKFTVSEDGKAEVGYSIDGYSIEELREKFFLYREKTTVK